MRTDSRIAREVVQSTRLESGRFEPQPQTPHNDGNAGSSTSANFAIFTVASSGAVDESAHERICPMRCRTRVSSLEIFAAFLKTSGTLPTRYYPERENNCILSKINWDLTKCAPNPPVKISLAQPSLTPPQVES
jgi:hypothetical protein